MKNGQILWEMIKCCEKWSNGPWHCVLKCHNHQRQKKIIIFTTYSIQFSATRPAIYHDRPCHLPCTRQAKGTSKPGYTYSLILTIISKRGQNVYWAIWERKGQNRSKNCQGLLCTSNFLYRAIEIRGYGWKGGQLPPLLTLTKLGISSNYCVIRQALSDFLTLP